MPTIVNAKQWGKYPACRSIHPIERKLKAYATEPVARALSPGKAIFRWRSFLCPSLNITAANNVIHYTRPWNPAKENQATDRVHRIGQEKEVKIYYPIVKDDRFVTVEERLAELIQSKSDLARDVLRPSAEFKLKPEDLIECIDDPNL